MQGWLQWHTKRLPKPDADMTREQYEEFIELETGRNLLCLNALLHESNTAPADWTLSAALLQLNRVNLVKFMRPALRSKLAGLKRLGVDVAQASLKFMLQCVTRPTIDYPAPDLYDARYFYTVDGTVEPSALQSTGSQGRTVGHFVDRYVTRLVKE